MSLQVVSSLTTKSVEHTRKLLRRERILSDNHKLVISILSEIPEDKRCTRITQALYVLHESEIEDQA